MQKRLRGLLITGFGSLLTLSVGIVSEAATLRLTDSSGMRTVIGQVGQTIPVSLQLESTTPVSVNRLLVTIRLGSQMLGRLGTTSASKGANLPSTHTVLITPVDAVTLQIAIIPTDPTDTTSTFGLGELATLPVALITTGSTPITLSDLQVRHTSVSVTTQNGTLIIKKPVKQLHTIHDRGSKSIHDASLLVHTVTISDAETS